MVTHGSLRVDDISLIVRKIYPFMSETHKRKICGIAFPSRGKNG